jgi:hypothetical protein
MRCLFYLLPIFSLACMPSTGKSDVDEGSVSAADEGGADEDDEEDWWGDDDDDDDDGDDDGGGGGDGIGEWEEADGYSVVAKDPFFGTDGDAWFFVEDLSDEFEDDSKDGDDEDESDEADDEASWVCLKTLAGMTPGCIEFIGEAWGDTPEFDPEAQCEEVADEDDGPGEWGWIEGECPEDPKAVCVFEEGTSLAAKLLYYNPTPLDDAEEQCLDDDGVFYALTDDDDDDWDDEDEEDLGTRWVGIMLMDGSFGMASFENFTETGDNCRAVAMMGDITEVEACEDCEFSRSFVVGDFDYEIDEGEGCPREELNYVVGQTVTFGHGTTTIFADDEGNEFRNLMYFEDE